MSPTLLELIQKAGFTAPTEIQSKSIPVALSKRDLVASARTGSGKTAAFCLPMIERFLGRKGTYGLILCPTREIALQTQQTLELFGTPLGITSVTLIGGTDVKADERALALVPHIIVGTPGRICDHIDRGNLWLEFIEMLVLDEADRMLDMGFSKELNRITTDIPKSRQTLLFSATIPQSIADLAAKILTDPERISVGNSLSASASVDHELLWVTERSKNRELVKMLESEKTSVIIFTRTKDGATKLWRQIHAAGIHESTYISSNKSQAHRAEALEGFKSGKYRVLVATDIAGRGIHVDDVGLVINYDLPMEPEDYIHRIGRTGRKEAHGFAVSLVTPTDQKIIFQIEKLLGKRIPERFSRDFKGATKGDGNSRGAVDLNRPDEEELTGHATRGGRGGVRGGRGRRVAGGDMSDSRPPREPRRSGPRRDEGDALPRRDEGIVRSRSSEVDRPRRDEGDVRPRRDDADVRPPRREAEARPRRDAIEARPPRRDRDSHDEPRLLRDRTHSDERDTRHQARTRHVDDEPRRERAPVEREEKSYDRDGRRVPSARVERHRDDEPRMGREPREPREAREPREPRAPRGEDRAPVSRDRAPLARERDREPALRDRHRDDRFERPAPRSESRDRDYRDTRGNENRDNRDSYSRDSRDGHRPVRDDRDRNDGRGDRPRVEARGGERDRSSYGRDRDTRDVPRDRDSHREANRDSRDSHRDAPRGRDSRDERPLREDREQRLERSARHNHDDRRARSEHEDDRGNRPGSAPSRSNGRDRHEGGDRGPRRDDRGPAPRRDRERAPLSSGNRDRDRDRDGNRDRDAGRGRDRAPSAPRERSSGGRSEGGRSEGPRRESSARHQETPKPKRAMGGFSPEDEIHDAYFYDLTADESDNIDAERPLREEVRMDRPRRSGGGTGGGTGTAGGNRRRGRRGGRTRGGRGTGKRPEGESHDH